MTGIIGTALGVGIAQRSAEHRVTRGQIARHNRVALVLTPFTAWLDSLSDADAYAYACCILGASKGSRYADRAAVLAHFATVTW